MPSPFPGMDPYLEPHWLDVHTSLVTASRNALNRELPTDLVASAEARIAIEDQEGDDRILAPDVRVFEPATESPRIIEEATNGGTLTLPYRLLAQVEPITERFITIIEARTERLVTVIEFVSPTNKRGEGLHVFRSKRKELVASGVNFVEIDLVRAGDWRALLRPHSTRRHASLYRVTMRLPTDPGAVQLQPIALQDRLPDIPIPLRKNEPPVILKLQPLLDQAYDNGRYATRIDYRRDLNPPLDPEDAAWADQMLHSAHKR